MAKIIDPDFDSGSLSAEGCELKFGPPQFSLGFNPPPFNFPPKLPKIPLSLVLSCDPSKPLKLTADLQWGGGRKASAPKSPDNEEEL